MSRLKFDGISFNKEWVASFKTEKDFLKEAEANKHWFEGDAKRTDKLKEVYSLATGKVETVVKEKEPAPAPEPAK